MQKLLAMLPEDGSAISYKSWRNSILADEDARTEYHMIHNTRRSGRTVWSLNFDQDGQLNMTVARASTSQEGGDNAN